MPGCLSPVVGTSTVNMLRMVPRQTTSAPRGYPWIYPDTCLLSSQLVFERKDGRRDGFELASPVLRFVERHEHEL